MSEIKTEGDLYYQNLVKSGLVEFLEKVVDELGKGSFMRNELPVVMAIDSLEATRLVTPYLAGGKRKTIDESFYGMDVSNYELLIKTSEGWRRTGYTVRFRTHN